MDALAKALKQKVSEYSLAPYADGRFEVYVDEELMYSKLETSDFPDDPTLVAQIQKKIG